MQQLHRTFHVDKWLELAPQGKIHFDIEFEFQHQAYMEVFCLEPPDAILIEVPENCRIGHNDIFKNLAEALIKDSQLQSVDAQILLEEYGAFFGVGVIFKSICLLENFIAYLDHTNADQVNSIEETLRIIDQSVTNGIIPTRLERVQFKKCIL